MDYIILGRQLDRLAKNDNTKVAPDDILKLILKYTGNISEIPTNIFIITIKFKCIKTIRDYNSDTNMYDKSYKNLTLTRMACCCETCGSVFQSAQSHYNSKKHKKLGNNKKYLSIQELYTACYKYLKRNYYSGMYKIQDITKITFGKECWAS